MDIMSMQPNLSLYQRQFESSLPSRFLDNTQQPPLNEAGSSSQANQSSPQVSQQVSTDDVIDVVRQLDSQLSALGMSIRFGVDEDSNRSFFSIEDSVSGEQVRQIPSDEILSISRNIQQFLETNLYARMGQTESSFAPGLLTDQQA
jgi:flagellar protein FlaG